MKDRYDQITEMINFNNSVKIVEEFVRENSENYDNNFQLSLVYEHKNHTPFSIAILDGDGEPTFENKDYGDEFYQSGKSIEEVFIKLMNQICEDKN